MRRRPAIYPPTQMPFWRGPNLALKFGTASSDRVDITQNSTIGNLTKWSTIALLKMSSTTGTRDIMAKYGTAANGRRRIFMNTGTAELTMQIRAGGGVLTITNTTDANLALDRWYLILGVYDESLGSGLKCNFWVSSGSDFNTLRQCAISSAADGGTGLRSESDGILRIGNGTAAAPNVTWLGEIAYFAHFDRALLASEALAFFNKGEPQRRSGLVVDMPLGLRGVGTQVDWSGKSNHGTVTGATVVPGVPTYSFPVARRTMIDAPWRGLESQQVIRPVQEKPGLVVF